MIETNEGQSLRHGKEFNGGSDGNPLSATGLRAWRENHSEQ
jgi:hypothetical protein